MHENPQVPGDDLACAKSEALKHHKLSPGLDAVQILGVYGAMFDSSTETTVSLSNLRKLQDASKFHKARFGFRLYPRD